VGQQASGELFGNQRRMKSDRTVGAVFTTGLIGDGVRGLGGIVRCILVIKIVLRVFGSYKG